MTSEDNGKSFKDIQNATQSIKEILVKCSKEKVNCVCGLNVRYLKDRHDLPEENRYVTELICDKMINGFSVKTYGYLSDPNDR